MGAKGRVTYYNAATGQSFIVEAVPVHGGATGELLRRRELDAEKIRALEQACDAFRDERNELDARSRRFFRALCEAAGMPVAAGQATPDPDQVLDRVRELLAARDEGATLKRNGLRRGERVEVAGVVVENDGACAGTVSVTLRSPENVLLALGEDGPCGLASEMRRLGARVDTLTAERDEARDEIERLRDELDVERSRFIEAERDASAEASNLRFRLEQLRREADRLRAEVRGLRRSEARQRARVDELEEMAESRRPVTSERPEQPPELETTDDHSACEIAALRRALDDQADEVRKLLRALAEIEKLAERAQLPF